jgi:hypothetical protein
MMTRHLYLAIAGLAIAAAVPAAATPTPRSDARYAATENRDSRQDARINNGIASGQINAHEAARLNASQTRVDNTQARLSADGYFSRRDYARVSYRQNRAGYGITRTRRNGR